MVGSSGLLSDSPIGDGLRDDHLEFSSSAKVLAEAAVDTEGPITIGIFGGWGTGKTSLMRLIQQEVAKEEERAVAVWFNAWQYEKEEHLIVPLTATIQKGIERDWPEKLAEGAKRLGDALRSIAYGFSIKGKVGVPLISEAEVNLSPKDMIERYQALTKDAVLARSLYFDAFEALEKCAREGKAPRVVVFVDDLDRCFPPKAVELLEGIKLVLDQPGFSFVLGVNDAIIQAFITTKYRKEYQIDPSHFVDYLDKIVQVKVPVPERMPEDMGDYIRNLIQKGSVLPEDATKDAIPLIAEACNRNPRSIVRMLNRIIVTSRIEQEEGNTEYDPLALLLHIATDDRRFEGLRKALDTGVTRKAQEEQQKEEFEGMTLGAYLANTLDGYGGLHREWIEDRKNESDILFLKSDFDSAIRTLESYEYLWDLLKLPPALKWLRERDYRNSMGAVSQSTVGASTIEKERPLGRRSATADVIRDLEANMVEVPDGEFTMGSEKGKSFEQPTKVRIIKPFHLGAVPVTQAQYEAIMGQNPSDFNDQPNNPVEMVSWEDASEFCRSLSKQTGRKYRLPTEAEWEYACRAGSEREYCYGDEAYRLDQYAWFDENSDGTTHPVGTKKPNAWGLYDMHGNVWEWVEDDWHEDYNGAPDDGSAWIDDPRGALRVMRGGSWNGFARSCRAAIRRGGPPDARDIDVGFRLARSVTLGP